MYPLTETYEPKAVAMPTPIAASTGGAIPKVPDMAHSMPSDIPVVTGIDNVPRTPRTPKVKEGDPHFYPVVKDTSRRDPQVIFFLINYVF